MSQQLKELYEDGDYCRKELLKVRDIFCNKSLITEETVKKLDKALMIMYLYSNQELHSVIVATIQELHYRASMFGIIV